MAISIAIGRVGFDITRWGEGPYEVGELDPDRYPLLAGVDPVGNTLFNQRQIPRLEAEVSRLLHSEECDAKARRSLHELQGLLRSARIQPHEFLWIVGD